MLLSPINPSMKRDLYVHLFFFFLELSQELDDKTEVIKKSAIDTSSKLKSIYMGEIFY
jgi:hypothetical protein